MTATRTPIPSRSMTVDVPFCTGFEPNWVAFQDGDGAWTRVLPVVVGQKTRFRYTFTSDRGAIAAVRLFPGSRLTALGIQYGRPDELTIVSDTAALDCGPPATRTLLGTAAGIDTNDFASISAGYGASALLAPSQREFSLRGLVPGPQDVLATRISRVNDTNRLTKVILRRTPALPDSTLLSTLDFNSAEAFAPVLVQVTLAGAELEGALLTTRLRTTYSVGVLGVFPEAATGNRRTIVAVPRERLRDGDLQVATVSAVESADARREAFVVFRAPEDQTLALGAPATMPALGIAATTPSLRLRATFDAQADYDRLTTVTFRQGQLIVTLAMTSAYAGVNRAGYDFVIPDLSSAAGFDSQWALHSNDPVFWTSARIGGSLGLGLNPQPFAGATSRSATRSGSFTP